MNTELTADAVTAAPQGSLALVEIIHLKWLLAREGVYLHVEQMLADADYARRMLQRGKASASAPLHDFACQLLERRLER